jgi:Ca-activated chloride channel family protein
MQPGKHELRYVTERSRTILARQPIEVMPVTATVQADEQVVLGAKFSVTWTGPNNKGDYVTIVPEGAPDEQYGDYVETDDGSPVELSAPPAAGDAEVRYVAAQGRKVLARRPIRVTMPEVSIEAPDEALAGSTIQVKWTGPNNASDYITIVASGTPDGQYANYTETKTGNPLDLLIPIMAGGAELRYQTGQGNKVLARLPIQIIAAEVKLSADAQCAPGADVVVKWTGPNHPGDYITIVPTTTPDGQYAAYTETREGSPLTVAAPKEPCDAEIRYMTGQGNKVLARIPIKVAP